MADTKISALTGVVTPADTDEFPCNQGGTTKKQTRLQILAAHRLNNTMDHPDNSVTLAKLADIAGLTVIGKSGAGAGDPAAIGPAAGAQVLRESGGSIGWGTIATAGIADDAVTLAKIAHSAGVTVLGKAGAGAGALADIGPAGADTVLRESAGALGFGKLVAANVSPNVLGDAQMAVGGLSNASMANRTRTVLVPGLPWNILNNALTWFDSGMVLSDPAAATHHATNHWLVPPDFVGGLTVELLIFGNGGGAGNLVHSIELYYGAVGEDYATHHDITANTVVAFTNNFNTVGAQVAAANAAPGDIIFMDGWRAGNDGLDTYGVGTYIIGFRISYTADM